ncbi:MAG: MFS transporter [Bacteroidales bacterium]|nr:MFS transporter [Bacteroidales bacterium]
MTEAIRKTLRESKVARWTALGIVAFTMLTGYLFTEILSPLKPMLESELGWSSSDFGYVTGAYGWFNVFLFMLILAGIILDKIGMRISGIAAAVIMVIGAGIKYYSIKYLPDTGTINFFVFDEFKTVAFTPQVLGACLGYALFGVGVEFAGITVSRVIVKWFKGKELALAMGLEMACARLGTFAAMAFAPVLARNISIPGAILVGAILLCIGLITFIIYFFMDVKLDKEIEGDELKFEEEKFKFSDMGKIFSSYGFWLIAILCVLFYSAVFPFYKYGTDLMFNKYGISMEYASYIPSLLPFGTLFLTPFFGNLYDKKGKGASIMILGALMLIVVHVTLFIPSLTSSFVAIAAIILLGIAFSLVPSAMWPSVPKIIQENLLGTAYALIFWIQNIGLWLVPTLLGKVLERTNPDVTIAINNYKESLSSGTIPPEATPVIEQLYSAGKLGNLTEFTSTEISNIIIKLREAGEIPMYNYTATWRIFVGLSIAAFVFALILKAVDKWKGYGLEKPNIEKV